MWGGFIVAQTVKNPPAVQGTQVRSLHQEDPLEKGMGYPTPVFWRIPWTEEPDGLEFMGSQRIRHDWGTNTFTFFSPGSHPGRIKSDHEWEGRHLIIFKVLQVIPMCRPGWELLGHSINLFCDTDPCSGRGREWSHWVTTIISIFAGSVQQKSQTRGLEVEAEESVNSKTSGGKCQPLWDGGESRKSRWKSGPTIKKIWKERGRGPMETHFTYFKITLELANYWNRKWGWGMWKGRLIQYFLVWRAGDAIHCGSWKRHGQIVTLKICFAEGTTRGNHPGSFLFSRAWAVIISLL